MGKLHGSAKSSGASSSGVTAQSSPACTRLAAKNQQGDRVTNATKPRRSCSICSTDSFELLEKKLERSISSILLEKFSEFEERFMSRFDQAVNSLNAEICKLNGEIKDLKLELQVAQHEINDIQRQTRLTNAVITGIPIMPDENPQKLIASVCAAIGHDLSPFTYVFRARSGMKKPLIAKFSSAAEQRIFLEKFRRKGKLMLSQISPGYSSETRLNAFESLAAAHQRILRKALRLRKENLLQSVFTRRGFVYICGKPGDPPKKIITMDELDAVTGVENDAEDGVM